MKLAGRIASGEVVRVKQGPGWIGFAVVVLFLVVGVAYDVLREQTSWKAGGGAALVALAITGLVMLLPRWFPIEIDQDGLRLGRPWGFKRVRYADIADTKIVSSEFTDYLTGYRRDGKPLFRLSDEAEDFREIAAFIRGQIEKNRL